MGKIMWIDCETTGLDPVRHAMIQLAYIIEIDGEEVTSGEILSRPTGGDDIALEALKVNGRTIEEIKAFPDIVESFAQFEDEMNFHVDRYNKLDKFVMAGFNVGFDKNFVAEWFKKAGNQYFGAWFHGPTIDVYYPVAQEILSGRLSIERHKLVTLCNHYNIKLDNAHDAMADIRATKQLYELLTEVKSDTSITDGEPYNRRPKVYQPVPGF